MLTVKVDFNATEDGLVAGLQRTLEGDGELAPGAEVLLDDGEGNEALGTIRNVEDELVYVEVDWTTWGRISGRTLVTVRPDALDRGSVLPADLQSLPVIAFDPENPYQQVSDTRPGWRKVRIAYIDHQGGRTTPSAANNAG